MKLSVCMATYNGEKYIKIQLKSILQQIKFQDEVIIVDDCSTDNTIAVINSFDDIRVRIIKNEFNVGFIKTFEKALYMATGDIVFLADQDDIWVEDKVAMVVELFHTQDVDLVVHDAIVTGINGEVYFNSLFELIKPRHGVIKNIIKGSFTGCCMAFRRHILADMLPIPKGVESHDQWIGVMTTLKGYKTAFFNEKLIYWQRHSSNVSPKKRRSLLRVAIGRLKLLSAIALNILAKGINPSRT